MNLDEFESNDEYTSITENENYTENEDGPNSNHGHNAMETESEIETESENVSIRVGQNGRRNSTERREENVVTRQERRNGSETDDEHQNRGETGNRNEGRGNAGDQVDEDGDGDDEETEEETELVDSAEVYGEIKDELTTKYEQKLLDEFPKHLHDAIYHVLENQTASIALFYQNLFDDLIPDTADLFVVSPGNQGRKEKEKKLAELDEAFEELVHILKFIHPTKWSRCHSNCYCNNL